MKKTLFLASMLSAAVSFAQELNFEEKTNALGLPPTKEGSLAYATINGKKAVLMTGAINDRLPATKLYLYDSDTKKFVEDTNAKFQGIKLGQAIFIDIDKDGDEDVALIGSRFDTPYFKIYENNNGTFTEKQDLNADARHYASLDKGDYNGDGYIDLLVSGQDKRGNKGTFIYENQNGTFVKNTTATFRGITEGDAKFFDANKDGKLDVVLSGKKNDYGTLEVYNQEENGTFAKTHDFYDNDYGYEGANVAVGDLNGVGHQDFIVTGRGYQTESHLVFNNNDEMAQDGEDNRFEPGFQVPNLKASFGKNGLVLADLDGDNKLDIIFASGEEGGDAETFIYKNENVPGYSESFVKYEGVELAFGANGSVLAFDYDDDGDLDLFITGENNAGELKAKFLENKKITLSNKEVATKASVELYPNPVSNEFRLKGIDKVSQISIYDMSGRLVKTFASQSQYNISGLTKGTYIVLVKGDKGTHQFKIVKN